MKLTVNPKTGDSVLELTKGETTTLRTAANLVNAIQKNVAPPEESFRKAGNYLNSLADAFAKPTDLATPPEVKS
jgi:hypothetical protein